MANGTSPWAPLLLLFLLFSSRANAESSKDADVLLNFKATLSSSGGDAVLGNWVADSVPCRGKVSLWTGVLCENGTVIGIKLENARLSGGLNIDALVGLRELRTLNFMNNSFSGSMPNISNIPALKAVYLSKNKFSGEIPDDMFLGFKRLKKLFLSENEFSGSIPSSLTRLTRLLELRLDSNQFSGRIPDFQQEGMFLFNVSNNDLQGQIPASLSKIIASMFAGNQDLCGPPLSVPCKPPPSSNKLSRLVVVAIILITIAALLAIIGLLLLFMFRRKREITSQLRSSKSREMEQLDPEKMKLTTTEHHGGGKKVSKEEQGKLMFVRENRRNFDLEDLLRASAEVLGSGNFGSSYKAVLFDGPYMVVKRFKEMNGVGREDFNDHMRRLGRLSHPNLLPLVAYYYRKDEKLLVTDYIPNGSLAHMLHGNRGTKLPPLAWPTRLKIIKGVTRALLYLYEELPMLTVPHGHLKSSNVLLDFSFEPILSDYALLPVMNEAHASQVMVAYKSPECESKGKPTKKSDIWSLGILILEILTGKFPASFLRQGRLEPDLVSWVNSVITEEWTEEVFDSNMNGTENAVGEMFKLLQIGMACCEADVNKRFDLRVAFENIEALKEMDKDKQ